MKKIDITPEAYNDLAGIKEELDEEFGEAQGKKILKAIIKDLRI